jgi:hypothetical protein
MAFSPLTQLIALLSGTGKLINRGGAKGATSAADVTSRSIDADHQALDTYDAATVSMDAKMPAAAAMTSDAEAASNTSRIGTRNQVWDDTQNSGGGGWSKLRAGLAKLTAASGKRSDAVGLLHVLGFARYIQAADRPTLATQDPVHAMANSRGDLTMEEQFAPKYEDNVTGVAWILGLATASSVGAWTSGGSGSTKVGTAGVSVKTQAARLKWAAGQNTNTATDFYLVAVNKNSAAAANDVTVFACLLPSTAAPGRLPQEFYSEGGKYFSSGIQFAISTTPEKVTFAGTSDCVIFWDVSP